MSKKRPPLKPGDKIRITAVHPAGAWVMKDFKEGGCCKSPIVTLKSIPQRTNQKGIWFCGSLIDNTGYAIYVYGFQYRRIEETKTND